MAVNFLARIRTELTGQLQRTLLRGPLVQADVSANVIEVTVTRGGEPETVGGITGYMVRNDGTTLALGGTASGNVARVTLPQAAYAIVGRAQIVIRSTTGGVATTIAWLDCTVIQSETDQIIDPGNLIPNLDTLLGRIADCEAAATAARAAATDVGAATQLANSAASAANTAASSANTAAGDANAAAAAANLATENVNAAAEEAREALVAVEDFAKESEAWARGTMDGTAVPSTDPAYQNNSKYYAEQAAAANTAAQTAKTDAVAANTAAQTAKTDAIAAKNDAQQARTDAVAANTNAQTAKVDAQTANSEAQQAKADAIAAKEAAEAAIIDDSVYLTTISHCGGTVGSDGTIYYNDGT